jgi:hypothetical protein
MGATGACSIAAGVAVASAWALSTARSIDANGANAAAQPIKVSAITRIIDRKINRLFIVVLLLVYVIQGKV